MKLNIYSFIRSCFVILLTSFIAANSFAAKGGGGKSGGGKGGGGKKDSTSYNCDQDTRLDEAMQAESTPVAPTTLKFDAFGGYDSSGYVAPRNFSAYQVFDKETGALLGYFTSGLYLGTNPLTTVYADGFRPNRQYELVLNSFDKCGNSAASTLMIDLGNVSFPDESINPVIDAEVHVSYLTSSWGSMPILEIQAHDDTALDKVTFSVNGVVKKVIDLSNEIKISFEQNQVDPTISQAYKYLYTYDFSTSQDAAVVEVEVIDIFGNVSYSEAVLDLPVL